MVLVLVNSWKQNQAAKDFEHGSLSQEEAGTLAQCRLISGVKL